MPVSAEVAALSSLPQIQPCAADKACEAAPATPSAAWFASLPDRARHERFFRDMTELLLEEAVFEGTSRAGKVVEWRAPGELRQLLDLEPSAEPASHQRLLELARDTVRYSVKTGHPYFLNQLFSSVDPYGLMGQWLGDALNPSAYTYEVAPVVTLVEEALLREMRRVVGFPEGRGDGVFSPGGSASNGYAISCARHHLLPEVKTRGLHGLPRLVLFTSEDAHYSIKKMGSFLGLGADNVYLVACDARGRMSCADLEAQVQRALGEGARPFMVCATAGTTVLGAFDPIAEVANVCERHGLWLHVDAAWGGGALLSRRHRHLLRGVERADSVTWNPHKLLTAPQQCSVFLVRHQGVLAASHSASAEYLFQKDKFYDTSYDTGDKHVQCGRRADALKFWFMWKAKGTEGLEKHVDTALDTAAHFAARIRDRDGFKMVLDEPEFANVCFWYVPPSLRGAADQPDFSSRLHKVAPKMKERMVRAGSMMVTYQPLRDLPNFFRLVVQNSGLTHADMDHVVDEFERLGADL
ncbi:cysteine sulfinic acid decarboxylase [Bacillus rossius redtenbacheri]|uniref:cysteine sulfinic acid decarboxylase n=1 Tax=Bacillus rossius redtenbacheri TaxID=93214 RepID=UPI002FDEF284